MGILRTLGKTFGTTVFMIAVSLLIVISALVQFTSYNSMKSIVSDILEKQLNVSSEQATLLHNSLAAMCNAANKETIDYPVSSKENITLRCSEITSVTPPKIISIISSKYFDKMYYRQYDCEFVECFRKLPPQELFSLFVNSETNKFLNSSVFYLELAIAVSLVIIVLSVRIWYRILRIVGISCIVVGAFYFIMPLLTGQLNIPVTVSSILNQMLSSISSNYLLVFEIGIGLTAAGYLGEYFEKRLIK